MLEDQVASLLQKFLGNYVRGLNKEALKISVWRGDVELTNMQLKPEALNALKLPVRAKAGFLGSVKLKVPWAKLGQEPVLVYLDRIFVLAEPSTEVEGSSEDAIQEAKRQRVREMEMKLLESQHQLASDMNTSWLGSFISTVIGNIKLSITNIHIRYEDIESNPGHPFAAGVMLTKLSAVTVDDSGKETFVTGGALDRIQKSVELEGLALYFDSDSKPWTLDKKWEDLHPSEWSEIFEVGSKDKCDNTSRFTGNKCHRYILRPVSGNARYTKLSLSEAKNLRLALQKVAIYLNDVTLSLSKEGYRDMLKLADNFSSFNRRLKHAHYQPSSSVKSDPRSWWKYAYKVVSDEMKKTSGKLSWEQLLRYARLRKKYVSLYASLLKADANQLVVDDNGELKALDRQLDPEVILQWRMLAHKFVDESTKSDKKASRQKPKRPWWSFGWTDSVKEESDNEGFTKEDWERLNKIIGYKENSDEYLMSVQDKDLMQFYFEIHMKHNASKLLSDGLECLADLSCEEFSCKIKLYPEAKIFSLKIRSYRLLSPYGLLAESALLDDSFVGVFSYQPFDDEVDWSFSAKASPCYVTYLKESVDQIVAFFKSSPTISQTLALETAAAVQMTIDGVKRTAQQQVSQALKDQSRFSLNLDIAAPKITIPSKFLPDGQNETKLLLDLGHLILTTKELWDSDNSEEQERYLQFNVALNDVSAFLVDGEYVWSDKPVGSSFLPVVDKCGIVLKFQQIKAESPTHPTTRLSVRVPSLGFHFSPARYHRLMEVMKVFQDKKTGPDLAYLWSQTDFEGSLAVLTWKGIGNREAVWLRRYLRLVGPFLYIFENQKATAYRHWLSLRGKHVYQPSTNMADDMQYILAIHDSGQMNPKILENSGALVLLCDDEEQRKLWQSRLQASIYRSSGSAGVFSLSGEQSLRELSDTSLSINSLSSDSIMETLFSVGSLDELKIHFSCSCDNNIVWKNILLGKERDLFEFRAVGGQVELSIMAGNILIGTRLKSLEVEDLYCCVGTSSRQFLARSFIDGAMSSKIRSSRVYSKKDSSKNLLKRSDSDDNFFEASDDFEFYDTSSQRDNFPDLLCVQDFLPSMISHLKPPSFTRTPGLVPLLEQQTTDEHSEPEDVLDSFVKAQIIIYNQSSPYYSNLDNRVILTLATLTFFCHRPTVTAIMGFMSALSSADVNGSDKQEDKSYLSVQDDATDSSTDVALQSAKKLLGVGKSKVVFYLTLCMTKAQILLMIDNGDTLATLSQNNLSTDIKVFPSSFSINAALGNLKISDDSLPSSHPYYWMCDMRNPGGSSFVEMNFSSYSPDDEDYCGYDYSLVGQLSEVKIIFLNRFVQEIISYFMGLAPSNMENAVKQTDHGSNMEKIAGDNDMVGSPALKLDLSFTRPIIQMPRRTDSKEFLQLDVLYITVENNFQWLGGAKDDMRAVHLDIMMVKIKDVNLNIGIDMVLGESIIQDVNGFYLEIHRSLRDLTHQSPVLEASVKVEVLKAVLSNREYEIITECALANLSETPRSFPPLGNGLVAKIENTPGIVSPFPSDTAELSSHPQNGAVWISAKFSVAVDLVELSLHSGSSRDCPFSTVQATGAYLLYKSNNVAESFLFATLKGFSVIDKREGIKEELRHAIGKSAMMSNTYLDGHTVTFDEPFANLSNLTLKNELNLEDALSMFIIDATFRKVSSYVSLHIQRPKFLVALDFLVAMVEFFVPSTRNLLSNEDDKDLLQTVSVVAFDGPVYHQPTSLFALSPKNPLIVDDERFDHFVYDGMGGKLYLHDRDGNCVSRPSKESVIYVLSGKSLQFKNVTIVDGSYLDSCISLGSDSRYSASKEDLVYLEAEIIDHDHFEEISEVAPVTANTDPPSEFILELQAISPELTFYSESNNVGEPIALARKVIHARMDLFSRFVMKGNAIEMKGNIFELKMESNGIRVIEPFDTIIEYANASGKITIHVDVTEVYMNFSFSILRLLLAVEEDLLAFLRMSSNNVSVVCSQFDKVGAIQRGESEQMYAFWRPRAPSGYAILGDCFTPLNESPSKGVLALNTSVARVKRPLSYKLVWQNSSLGSDFGKHHLTSTISNKDVAESYGCCSIWLPIPPEGYVALGCIVSSGASEPPLSTVWCIRSLLVSPCSLKDCIIVDSNESMYGASMAFWRVDNSFATFLPASSQNLGSDGRAYDLRHMLFKTIEPYTLDGPSGKDNRGSLGRSSQVERSITASGLIFEAIASFKLIWWNNGVSSPKKLSIWRPILPQGMVFLGDIAINGYEPPNSAITLCDDDCTLLRSPLEYQHAGRIRKWRGLEGISFWYPVAPPGFVSLGCVASKGPPSKEDFVSLRCIRSDMVSGGQFPEESIWDTSGVRVLEPFSLWSSDSAVTSFFVRSGFKRPPRRLALTLAGPSASRNPDNIVIDAEIRTLSAVAFDDYGGLMVPLFEISFDNVALGLHGSSDYSSACMSFSFAARSYNDKYDSWEPVIEPTNGFLRYQYDCQSMGAPTQLRMTTTQELNFNVSVSNVNMLSQAYASWNNLNQANRNPKDDICSSSKSILDVNHRRNFHIVPQNKLGQDIYVRVMDAGSFRSLILSLGADKLVKIPVSENFLDSYVRRRPSRLYHSMLAIFIGNAEITEVESLGASEYMTVVNLLEEHPVRGLQQCSRTCATISVKSVQGTAVINWNEMFCFIVNQEGEYRLELVVLDAVRGKRLGFFSAPLRQIVHRCPPSNTNESTFELSWRELSPIKSSEYGCNFDDEMHGKIRFAAMLSNRHQYQGEQVHALGMRSTHLQISPAQDGPWTSLKLNYAAPATPLQFGSDIIASEVTVQENNILVDLRSVVAVTNHSRYAIYLRSRSQSKSIQSSRLDIRHETADKLLKSPKMEIDEFIELQKYDPLKGWTNCDSDIRLGAEIRDTVGNEGPAGLSTVVLPDDWVWTDTWHVDTTAVGKADGWVYYPPDAIQSRPLGHTDVTNYSRQRRWIRNRKYVGRNEDDHVIVGQLNPGSSTSLPLPSLTHQSTAYVLQIKPMDSDEPGEFSWSEVQERRVEMEGFDTNEFPDICVSHLVESDNLLFCPKLCGSSSTVSQGLWFCLSIVSKQIGKDIHADPVYDWNIVIKSPLSLVHNLPVAADYTVSTYVSDHEAVISSHETLEPGGTLKVHNCDPRGPIYVSLVPEGGWQNIHEPVPISHPRRLPTKSLSLRNILSGRIVQIKLEQSNDNDYLVARLVSVYVPYWISCARLPPLVLRFVDISGHKSRKYFPKHSQYGDNERILWQINQEELVGGYTIASGLNFKVTGLSASIGDNRDDCSGPVKELSPLGDMDGHVDLYASDLDNKCMHIFVSSKPCSFQAVPTKVIYVRPFVTFTNRMGENIFIKFNAEDETKSVCVYDQRSSFSFFGIDKQEKLQVRLEGTHWCRPLEIMKEDTIVITLRRIDGGMNFIKAEVRGYEEGSRFLIIFRLGPADGPIRFENRSRYVAIDVRQAGLDDDSWVHLLPLSSTKYSWDEPYGKRILDIRIHSGELGFLHSVDMENNAKSFIAFEENGIQLLVGAGDIMVLKFIDHSGCGSSEVEELPDSEHIRNRTTDYQNSEQSSAAPWELIVELGTVGISLIDMSPRELLYFYLERVFISFLMANGAGTSNRFKLIIGHLQLDNQLPLSAMPAVLFSEDGPDLNRPALKTNISFHNVTADGVQVFPHVYIRVAEKVWRLNIHEPIIWGLIDFYNNLHFGERTSISNVTEVDPEIRFEIIDISEVRLKVALETAPSQRPRGALGIWSPLFSAIGNAFKIQVHLRKVLHGSRFMRKSYILPAILNRIKRDLIHNPLHLIFSVNVLGVTKSTFATLSKGFAELSTDGQFLQLRSKQVWSRRITGLGDGIAQGTEAFAQGVAFGVSGVVTKPVESARQYGLLGIVHGVGRALLGFVVEPLSGALDFVSLTVDGVSASFIRCLEILNNRSIPQRIRNPRAVHSDCVIREYNKREAAGQMVLYLAEASRHLACTDIFREPSKYAWSDFYEDHFIVPYQRIVLVTNKRMMLLQCLDLDKMDRRPSKILWDIPWEEVLALELARAGFQRPSHLIIHLKNFRKGENFVRLIKCSVAENENESQASRLCSSVRKIWRAYQAGSRVVALKVPSSQRYAYFCVDDMDSSEPNTNRTAKPLLKPERSSSCNDRLVKDTLDFSKIWSSEHESRSRCTLFLKQVADDERIFSLWRPLCPDGYISIGDIARVGSHPPTLAAIYKFENGNFALPVGYDLVWRNCPEDYASPVSIWLPRPPEGFAALGCVGISAYEEPPLHCAYCVSERIVVEADFEELVWASRDAYPWGCHIYQVNSDALQFIALRRPKKESEWLPRKISYSSENEASADGGAL